MGCTNGGGERRTRDVLRKELSTDFLSFGTAMCVGVPDSSYEEVCVVSWVDVDVFRNGLAYNGFIDQDIDVEVGYGGRIVGRIGDIDICLQCDGGASRFDNGEISNFRG